MFVNIRLLSLLEVFDFVLLCYNRRFATKLASRAVRVVHLIFIFCLLKLLV